MGDWGSEWFGWLVPSIRWFFFEFLSLSEFLGFFSSCFLLIPHLFIFFRCVVEWLSRRRFLACSPSPCNMFTLFPHLIRFPFPTMLAFIHKFMACSLRLPLHSSAPLPHVFSFSHLYISIAFLILVLKPLFLFSSISSPINKHTPCLCLFSSPSIAKQLW
jgi:hypothetical protein